MTFTLDEQLTLDGFIEIVRNGVPVEIGVVARARVVQCRDYVEAILEADRVVYGVTTGFGKFANVRIAAGEVKELQRNLLLSHAIGVGESFPAEVVRGMLLLRAKSLSLGYSGVRPVLIDYLLTFLNSGVHPIVPSQGSVGASGDLAPLAHMCLPLIGEGEVEHNGQTITGAAVLEKLGLEPLILEAKEGLALINGTQAMASMMALLVWDTRRLFKSADIAAAVTIEALKGSHQPFDPGVTRLRPHPGAIRVSENIGRILRDSEIQRSHIDCDKVQDAYSMRTVPQVHGASRDALSHVMEVVERELNSVTDNPLIFPEEDKIISAGNFHRPAAGAGSRLSWHCHRRDCQYQRTAN